MTLWVKSVKRWQIVASGPYLVTANMYRELGMITARMMLASFVLSPSSCLVLSTLAQHRGHTTATRAETNSHTHEHSHGHARLDVRDDGQRTCNDGRCEKVLLELWFSCILLGVLIIHDMLLVLFVLACIAPSFNPVVLTAV